MDVSTLLHVLHVAGPDHVLKYAVLSIIAMIQVPQRGCAPLGVNWHFWFASMRVSGVEMVMLSRSFHTQCLQIHALILTTLAISLAPRCLVWRMPKHNEAMVFFCKRLLELVDMWGELLLKTLKMRASVPTTRLLTSDKLTASDNVKHKQGYWAGHKEGCCQSRKRLLRCGPRSGRFT